MLKLRVTCGMNMPLVSLVSISGISKGVHIFGPLVTTEGWLLLDHLATPSCLPPMSESELIEAVNMYATVA